MSEPIPGRTPSPRRPWLQLTIRLFLQMTVVLAVFMAMFRWAGPGWFFLVPLFIPVGILAFMLLQRGEATPGMPMIWVAVVGGFGSLAMLCIVLAVGQAVWDWFARALR